MFPGSSAIYTARIRPRAALFRIDTIPLPPDRDLQHVSIEDSSGTKHLAGAI
jgi:hypothetical protein